MKITEFLCKAAVVGDLTATSKPEVIAEMVGLLVEGGALEKKHKNKVIDVLMAREALGSTAIGQGIAIPHGKAVCGQQRSKRDLGGRVILAVQVVDVERDSAPFAVV